MKKLPLITLFSALAATAYVQAEEVAYHEDYSKYEAGITAAEITNIYTWSELPHPLNPTIADIKGDRSLSLNSALAYPERAGSTVISLNEYAEAEDLATFYANVSFDAPLLSTVGVTLKLNRSYQSVIHWDAALTVDTAGAGVSIRIDEIDDTTNARRTLVEKTLPRVDPKRPIALGLRISRSTGRVEALIARAPVVEAQMGKRDLTELPDIVSPGVFAFNGQAARFDDLTLIIDEKVSTEPMP